MTDLLLYTAAIPQDSQSSLPNYLQQQLATSGILDQDGGIVEQLSSEPGDQTISGYFRARYADLMAAELEELAQASGFDDLALSGIGEATSVDGYYSLESADVEQVAPQTPLLQSYEITLRHRGTKDDQWRALEPNPHQLDHQFGNDLEGLVGIPAAASKVQWFHPEDKTRKSASPVETRSAELGDIGIYDLADALWFDPPPFDEGQPPTLLYEIDYTAEENVDCRVYDTCGHSSKMDENGDLQWQKLFSTQHDFDDPVVLDNGLLRLRLDEPNATLEAETWDDTNTTWTTVGLETDQPATISLFDVDLTDVAMIRDQAQLTFDVDGSLFSLNAIVNRGAEDILFSIPENEEGPIPTDLEEWLEPIAADAIVDPNASKELVARSEVRR